jgi:hypothetical protein
MQPGEYSSRPPSGRQPQPRQYRSIDGIARRPVQPAPVPGRPQAMARRPLAPRRPVDGIVAPIPATQPTQQNSVQQAVQQSPLPPLPTNPAAPIENVPQPIEPSPAQPSFAPRPEPVVTAAPAQHVADTPVQPEQAELLSKKRRLRFAVPRLRVARKVVGFGLLGVILVGGLVFGYGWYTKRNAPDVVMREALEKSFQVQSVTSQVTQPASETTTIHDFRTPKAPVTSSESKIAIAGVTYGVKAYGALNNTYINYAALPQGIAAPLTKSTENVWVQLRTNGQQPAGVNATLVNLSSPGFQSSGPVVFGNFPATVRQQLLSYIEAQNVYKYDPKKVTKTTVDGVSVYAYPVTLNVGYLKVLNQSAAASAGVPLSDVLKATAALDQLKDAQNTLYIAIGSRQITGFESVKGNTKLSYQYVDINKASAPEEPRNAVTWPSFAASHLQLQNQAAAGQTAAVRDAVQLAKLESIHTALAVYFSQTNSYPAFNEMNNQAWIAANLANFDPDWLHDNGGSNLAVAAAPKAGVFAYQPVGADGKTCVNTPLIPCAHYKLIGLTSGKQQAVVQDP